jgi:hypothetical protein
VQEALARNILATVPCNTREKAFSDERRESPESRFLFPTIVNRRLSAAARGVSCPPRLTDNSPKAIA